MAPPTPAPASSTPSKESLSQAHQSLFTLGLAQRKAVAGASYVDTALANASSSYARPMQELVTEFCWGSVWTRPGLALKTRSLLNLAMLCALNRSTELAVHTRGALNNGASEVEIRETILQAAVYCGMPAGMEGFKVTERVIKEWKAEHGIEGEVMGDEARKNKDAEEAVRDVDVGERMNLEGV
ncbi:protocatechuate 3,4-dioxygenase, P3,4O [Myriangium duriaei CBS 260.36]|uniref:Protocatechuate 3,4-dioxygenase, P3,4O n=1 Tax=Myriangium duriaei CBS 260.36 TaxID=1168546 RepID=A0A9P4J2H8_9PEZI|nr:protocatechuate 3,4-dioxygenase, P3,4O [Myriangium duriaei CBS 260.36]